MIYLLIYPPPNQPQLIIYHNNNVSMFSYTVCTKTRFHSPSLSPSLYVNVHVLHSNKFSVSQMNVTEKGGGDQETKSGERYKTAKTATAQTIAK